MIHPERLSSETWGQTWGATALGHTRHSRAGPSSALAYAAGGRSDVAPPWVPEVFGGIDPDALRGLALQRIERRYGPRAARAAADLAARGTRADLDALVLGLGWRGASHPTDGLHAAATVAAADLDLRARRFARRLVFALGVLLAVALGVLAGFGGANLDAGSAVSATLGVALGATVGSRLLGYAGRIDAAEGCRWGTLLRDLTRPPSDAAETWHQLTARRADPRPPARRVGRLTGHSGRPHTNTPPRPFDAATWRHGPRCAAPDGPTRAAVGEPYPVRPAAPPP